MFLYSGVEFATSTGSWSFRDGIAKMDLHNEDKLGNEHKLHAKEMAGNGETFYLLTHELSKCIIAT
ncbi:MAG: hypothetical protein WD361_10000 [Gracilimonas sp.]